MSKIKHRSVVQFDNNLVASGSSFFFGHLSASSANFGGTVSFAEDLAISGTLQFQHMSASSAIIGHSLVVGEDLAVSGTLKFQHMSASSVRIGESLVVGEDATVSGSFKVGNSMAVRAKEGDSAYILIQADDSDDAGDDWKLTAGSTFTIGNDIASAGSDVAHVTITPNATVASSTTAVAGILTTGGVIKVGGNKIQASDGGDTITMDTSDNVTIAGDLTVAGHDLTFGATGNTTAATISAVTNTGTTAGKGLTISAGSTTTGLNNLDGGNLTLASGGGDGTGTSQISFKTKVSGVDAAAERMLIHGNGNIGIGNPHPEATLVISKVSGQPSIELSAWSATADATHASALIFQKAGTATINTFTAGDHTTSGEVLGRIEAKGVTDGDQAKLSSYIEFANDAVSSADSVPGKIVFATAANDGLLPAVRLTIDDDGVSTFTADVKTSGDVYADKIRRASDSSTTTKILLNDEVIKINAGHSSNEIVKIESSKMTVNGAAAFSGPSTTFVTFDSSDPSPSVATGNLFKTHASGQTLIMFLGGTAGQIINVISTAAVVYDVTGTNLKGGSADITTADGDVTTWVFDGNYWYLLNFMDVSADLSGGH